MLESIVKFSVTKKLFVGLTTIFLLIGGVYSMLTLPVDAVPDITNNQVQIVTVSPTLAPQEVERLITMPVEIAMSNIMNVVDIRSVSRFGLSVVTVVFKESVPILDARQLINEQIQMVREEIPSELGSPEMMPISTGLGEIYQYVLQVDSKHKDKYDAMELRTIQDWIVKRQLSGIPGIVEINSFGGYMKQYQVAVDPNAMFSLNITIEDVFDALSKNNQNTGGSYIEKADRAYYIRSEGMISDLSDIEKIAVANRAGVPVLIKNIGKVSYGTPKRFGAMTKDGDGECVGGIAMMLKGANANQVTAELEKRVEKIQKILPEGVSIEPYLNRSALVSRNISTVIYNLVEGAIIVFLVLILFLGNLRAGLIVASVIPLAMLFAFILMRLFGVSANLMSLGAIDFGIVVDGSIVLVEGILAHLYSKQFFNKTLSEKEFEKEIIVGTSNVVKSATFAVFIILIVFFPILTLTGIEGKYFTPMAKTLVFCIIGALLLSVTYVPMMSVLILKRKISSKPTFADKFFKQLNRIYQPILHFCLNWSKTTLLVAFILLSGSVWLFTKIGSEFIPTLDEGDFAMQMTLPAGSSLSKSIELSTDVQKVLMKNFPEIKHVVAKIGTAEVPTDPMAVEDADVMIVMKPFNQWTSASSRAEMVEKMKASLDTLEGAEYNFSQPIQLRFNELMTGAKADIAIKLYGENMEELYSKAKQAAEFVKQVPGASDVIVEQAMGLPQLVISYNRETIARYGVDIEELNNIIRTAYAGEKAGVVFENERRFDLVVRVDKEKLEELDLNRFFVRTSEGVQIPVSELASVKFNEGPLQINRDATKRRVVIGVNVRGADIGQVVAKIQEKLDNNVKLNPGYYFEYGGQFENLQKAINTLLIVIPVALMLILLLLFFAFRSVTYTLVVFSTVPLSLIGGILALWLTDMPFSISAGVGFIALFGVAVLNGILMINHFNQIRDKLKYRMTTMNVIKNGSSHLLRPVFLTGLVASLGFVPMAIAKTAGAEVQRPLATVVIGGLIISTILTLIIIPVFYKMVGQSVIIKRNPFIKKFFPFICLILLLIPFDFNAQERITLEKATEMALERSPQIRSADMFVKQNKAAKGEIWEVGNTSVSYTGGQINSNNKDDMQIDIEQSLGSLLTPFYKNSLVKTNIENANYKKQLVIKEVTAEVRRAWVDYLYSKSMFNLYQKQVKFAKEIKNSGYNRYKNGDIALLEQKVSASLAAQMENRLLEAEYQSIIAGRRLQWVCFSDKAIFPSDSSLSVLFKIKDEDSLALEYKNLYNTEVEAARKQVKIEKSRFFPEISAGYTRQNILPDRGLNSWNVGIIIPIIGIPQISKIRQAEFLAQQVQSDAKYAMTQLNIKVSELFTKMIYWQKSVDMFNSSLLPEVEEINRSTRLLLENNDIDITQAVQSFNQALEIERSYIDALKQLNIAILEYELYTSENYEKN